ncbi:MBL fold metallo-hydrolase [Chitinimonas sp. BJYL2]|uniref:MBL fold metallo-hydrolase n=1 Tax=Chitinimonas sp. BJYL2 TaxID=2976696 RepID=UPI0022B4F8B8|nr:MBL fold metallo-hydrolase [Chitinimonas sp. BJYL2]
MLRPLFALLVLSLCHAADYPLSVTQLAPGVYATVRTEPPGFAVESNSVFIIGDDDVIVVDAQSNLPATRRTLEALRQITDKPVRYVINTHWHDDHIVGNAVYRDAFPGVSFIGHANARRYLEGPGIKAREAFHKEGMPGFRAVLQQALDKGRNLAGQAITEEERISYLSDLQLADGYDTVPANFLPELPNLTVTDTLTLHHGAREIVVRHLGRGHTSGDLVVWLPDEGILCAGDLVVWPVPLIGADQSHVADWSRTISRLIALKPKAIVPGHGPVLRDTGYLLQLRALMTAATERTRAAMAYGRPLTEVHRRVNLDDFRRRFAGESPVRQALFRMYVESPAVTSAYNNLNLREGD